MLPEEQLPTNPQPQDEILDENNEEMTSVETTDETTNDSQPKEKAEEKPTKWYENLIVALFAVLFIGFVVLIIKGWCLKIEYIEKHHLEGWAILSWIICFILIILLKKKD